MHTGMYSQMPFQFVCVGTGVCAVRTLVRPFAGVAAHVPLQFGQLDGRVIALGTPVRLLVRVPVPHVTDQFAGRRKRRVAVLAAVRPHSRVSVHVVLQRRDCLRERRDSRGQATGQRTGHIP